MAKRRSKTPGDREGDSKKSTRSETEVNATSQRLVLDVLQTYHKILLAEMDRARTALSMKRIPDAGRVLEAALHSLLRQLLPSYAGVVRGIVVDTNFDKRSREMDIIIVDRRYFAGYPAVDDAPDVLSVVPIDVVLAVISVKRTLTPSALKDAVDTIHSVLTLARKPTDARMHYDYAVDTESMSIPNATVSDRIVSAVVGFSNALVPGLDLSDERQNGAEILKRVQERDWFNGIRADLIFTVDGSLFYPLEWQPGWKAAQRRIDLGVLETPKGPALPYYDAVSNSVHLTPGVFFGYCVEARRPEKVLGQFLTYILSITSRLVRSSPNLSAAFRACFDVAPETLLDMRPLSSINITGQDPKFSRDSGTPQPPVAPGGSGV